MTFSPLGISRSQNAFVTGGRKREYTMTGRLHLDPDTSPETAPGSRYQISEPLLEPVSTQRSTGHVVSPQHGYLTLISCTSLALFLNCAVNGLVTLNISQIASDYDLSPGVELW